MRYAGIWRVEPVEPWFVRDFEAGGWLSDIHLLSFRKSSSTRPKNEGGDTGGIGENA